MPSLPALTKQVKRWSLLFSSSSSCGGSFPCLIPYLFTYVPTMWSMLDPSFRVMVIVSPPSSSAPRDWDNHPLPCWFCYGHNPGAVLEEHKSRNGIWNRVPINPFWEVNLWYVLFAFCMQHLAYNYRQIWCNWVHRRVCQMNREGSSKGIITGRVLFS